MLDSSYFGCGYPLVWSRLLPVEDRVCSYVCKAFEQSTHVLVHSSWLHPTEPHRALQACDAYYFVTQQYTEVKSNTVYHVVDCSSASTLQCLDLARLCGDVHR